jgi:hypothetical protein
MNKSFTLNFNNGQPLNSITNESFECIYIIYSYNSITKKRIPLYIGYTTEGLTAIANHNERDDWERFVNDFDFELYVTIANYTKNDIELVKHCLIYWCFNNITKYWLIFNQSDKKDFGMNGYDKITLNITGRPRLCWYDAKIIFNGMF